ncbi:bacterial Ig-like domain-containing protein [Lactiplantibacillus songbeiensis]|uniref:Bacterial Ig-like domain-containing protein n=1 Tax=Lactiplantibacillus songbeiensis TaxID=2559920 RepID=A0ABW4BZ43_9LACO|nr:BspA family leucine-rich repeat surface protein [Lactiplantibacillus songbeiensis]
MAKKMGSKLHYKMYKQGRFWVFAGLTLLTWQIGNTTTAQADTAGTTAKPATATTQVAAATTSGEGNSVKLSATPASTQSNYSQAESATTSTDSTANSSEAASSAASSQQSQSGATESQSVTSGASSAAQSQTDGNSQSATSQSSQAVASVVPKDQSSDVAPASSAVMSAKDNNTKQLTVEQAASTATTGQTSQVAKAMVTSQAPRQLSRSALLRDTAVSTAIKGVNGDVAWSFDASNGALTLGGGTLGSPDFTYTDADNALQKLNRDDIKSMAVTGKLVVTGLNGVGLFSYLSNGVTGLNQVDVSQATSLNSMFFGSKLDDVVNLNGWDVHSVTDMSKLFSYTTGVTDIEVNDWHTDNLANMDGTFLRSSDLVTVNATNWNTSKVEYMSELFENSEKLANVDVSKWNVSKVTTFWRAFYGTTALKNIDVSSWTPISATIMASMFEFSGVTYLDLSTWNMTKVTDNSEMMGYASGQGNTFDLVELKVSPTFKFISEDFSWYNNIGQVTTYPYTGKWVNARTSEVLTYQELDDFYRKGATGTAETYLAQEDYSDRTQLTGQDINIYQNTDWSVISGIASLKDARGEDVFNFDPSQFSYTGSVNQTKLGQYPITLTYTSALGNQFSAPINVNVIERKSKATIGGQDVTVVIGSDAEANLAAMQAVIPKLLTGTIDSGSPMVVGQDQVQVIESYADGSPITTNDYTIPAVYKFVFSYRNTDDVLLTQTSFLTLVESQAKINLKAPTIIIGPTAKLSIADYFDNLINAAGQSVDDAAGVTFTGVDKVDLTKAGDYTISADYTDTVGNLVTATTTVRVIENTATLNLTAPTQPLIAGPKTTFDPTSVITTAVTAMGTDMTTANGLTIDNTVDPQKAGTYTVTVSYQDNSGNQLTKQVQIVVVSSRLALTVQPTTELIVGEPLDLAAQLITAKDATGQAVALADLTIDLSQLNTAKAGTYPVAVSYTDAYGNTLQRVLTVTVKASPIAIQTVPQVNLLLGDNFEPTSAVTSATGIDGQPLAKTALSYDVSQVNLKQGGTYTMWVSYRDQYQNTVKQPITINVSALSLELTDALTVTQGTTFDPASLVKLATNALGQAISASQLTITGTVNTTVPGKYQLQVTNQDRFGHQLTKSMTVTVLASTPDPEVPTDPSTPTNPETPTNPSTPTNPETPTDPGTTPTPDHPNNGGIVTPPTDVDQPDQPIVSPAKHGTKQAVKTVVKVKSANQKTGQSVIKTGLKQSQLTAATIKSATTTQVAMATIDLAATTQSVTTKSVTATIKPAATTQAVMVTNKSATTQSAMATIRPAKAQLKAVDKLTVGKQAMVEKPLPQTSETKPSLTGTILLATTAVLATLGITLKRRHN